MDSNIVNSFWKTANILQLSGQVCIDGECSVQSATIGVLPWHRMTIQLVCVYPSKKRSLTHYDGGVDRVPFWYSLFEM